MNNKVHLIIKKGEDEMSQIKIDSRIYDTSRLDEKIKTYDFDKHTSVGSLLELINDQADSLISLEIKCSKLEEENKNLTFWKNQLEKQISPNWENTKRDCFQKSSTKKGS
jgi:hypothetical protein